ncbi:MAG: PA14 domain-containing protein [Dehalococcoidales bacterium]|nr:PA14 domain-containing protein [Dehalococcoidales bacterium]
MVGRLLAIVIAIPLLAFAALPDTFTQMLGGEVLSPLARLEVPVAQSAGGYQPGVYAYDDYGFEDPSVYTFLNGGTFNRSWRSAQDGKWGYTDPAVTPPFGSFEYYVRRIAGSKDGTGGQTRPDGKKMKMMLAISQHDLTAQHVDQWGNVQGDETPDWVYAQYGVPKIIFTTTSDGKQWQFPKWTDGIDANGNIVGPTTYLSAVERMVQDFAKDYNGDPRIEGIWVGIGGHGEGWPYPWIIDQQMTNYGTQVGQMFIDQGVTPKAWATFVSRTIAIYKKYFTQTQLFYSGAKHPRSDWGTYRAMNDDAVKQGMNLAAHYLSASPESAYFAYPGFSGWFERWSHVRDYVQDAVGIPEPKKLWSESGANGNIFNPATSERYSYWEALMALDKRVTYLGLYNVQSQNPNLAPVYNMVDEYAGKTLSNTPGVWVAFRKENPGMYDPQADGTYQITINSPAGSNTRTVTIYANYGEWLTQYNPDGTTVPLWDIGGKEGMFARRTDLASGKDSFYLNVDDGYIGPTVGARFNTSASGQPTRIKITYLDSGTSRFEVRYDAFGNANKLAGTVTKANTGAWKTATFDVNDAYFGGRMLGGSDIRILAVSGDVTLHMVEIRTLSAGSAVTPTPTPVHSATATPTQIPATPTPKQIPPTATPTQLPTSTPVPTSVPTATPTPAANPASPTWKGEYYANATLSGTPALVRNDAAINFDWGNGPAAPGLPADNFSARWTSTQQFNAGLYRFHTMADDGIRLWVDGKLVVDDWSNHSARERTGDITLAAGAHSIKVEYYDWVIAAVAKTWWEKLQ